MILNTKSKTPKRYTGKLPSLNCTVENDGKPKGSKIADYMDWFNKSAEWSIKSELDYNDTKSVQKNI